jgi:hypothetical protein
MVLPAGTGHCSAQSNKSYKNIGVYPEIRGPLFELPFPHAVPISGFTVCPRLVIMGTSRISDDY